MTEPFRQKVVRYSEKIEKLKPEDWHKIKETLIQKFRSKLPEKRKYVRKCKYDINGSKLTDKQWDALQFENQIINDYNNGFEIEDFAKKYGKNRLRRIKRIVFSNMLRKVNDPIEVIVKNQPKVELRHVNEIVRIATQKDFHGSCKRIKQELAMHSDQDLKIELSEKTISKILRQKKVYYKRLKIVKRTSTRKSQPSYEQRKDLAEII